SSSGYHNHARLHWLYHLREASHETHSTCRPLTKDNRCVCTASLVSLALLSTPFNPIKKSPEGKSFKGCIILFLQLILYRRGRVAYNGFSWRVVKFKQKTLKGTVSSKGVVGTPSFSYAFHRAIF